MKTEFVSLTFVKSCTGFKSSVPTGLPDYHPTSFQKGVKGCIGIFTAEEGGFDVFGEDGQHFWVAMANCIWGRKAVHPKDGVAVVLKPVNEFDYTPPSKTPELDPVKGPEKEVESLLQVVNLVAEPPKPATPQPQKAAIKPRGRPRRFK
jgi:hypothetical protein